jgi:magnesium-dependent phosphatase 1
MASATADTSVADKEGVPSLAVFDLDACLWNQEMFQLSVLVDRENPVTGPLTPDGEIGVIGARSGGVIIKLHPGALHALQRFHAGDYPGMRCAAASSADTPLAVSIGRSALNLLEVVPGVTVREVLAMGFPEGFEGNLQIGRTPPLSPNKAATHFPFLRNETHIPFDKMLFFDDCNWGDHCAAVGNGCREKKTGLGPVTVRTPRGLQIADWEEGMSEYRKRLERRLDPNIF